MRIVGRRLRLRRAYEWLHSPSFRYSNAGKLYGLPGSFRVPYITSWSIADHLRLEAGRARALKILLASPWDGGIVSEQIDPTTAASIPGGGAFATAAGYLAATVCDLYCRPRSAALRSARSASVGTHASGGHQSPDEETRPYAATGD